MKQALSLCFFALFAVILSGVLSGITAKYKGVFCAGCTVLFFLYFVRLLQPILQSFSQILSKANLSGLFENVLKGLGISILVTICSSFCRDLGEDSIASKLEIGGKAIILTLSLPILQEILNLIGELLT